MRMSRRVGAAMLEVLTALTLLAITGAVIISLMMEAHQGVRRSREREREVRQASSLLTSISLWPRADLELRLGSRRQGPFQVRIDRLTPHLFEVAVADSGQVPLLVSRMYRE